MKQYHIIKAGIQSGPIPEADLVERVVSGDVSSSDLCWSEGMPEWQAISAAIKLPSSVPPPPPVSLSSVPPPAPIPTQLTTQNNSSPEIVLIPKRDKMSVILLSIFTLNMYGVYLTAKNAQEIGFLTGRRRLDFVSIIILSILTLTLFTVVYQTILSYSLHEHSSRLEKKGRDPNLNWNVLLVNILLVVVAFGSGLWLLVVSIALAAIILWAIQEELNLYSNSDNNKS